MFIVELVSQNLGPIQEFLRNFLMRPGSSDFEACVWWRMGGVPPDGCTLHSGGTLRVTKLSSKFLYFLQLFVYRISWDVTAEIKKVVCRGKSAETDQKNKAELWPFFGELTPTLKENTCKKVIQNSTFLMKNDVFGESGPPLGTGLEPHRETGALPGQSPNIF